MGLKNHLFASQHLTGNVAWLWFSPQAQVRQLTAWMDFQWQKNSGVRWFFEFINLESGSNTYELPSPPPNVPLKGTMLKGNSFSNHWLSRDILVFRGVAIRQLFECKLLKKLLFVAYLYLCIICYLLFLWIDECILYHHLSCSLSRLVYLHLHVVTVRSDESCVVRCLLLDESWPLGRRFDGRAGPCFQNPRSCRKTLPGKVVTE